MTEDLSDLSGPLRGELTRLRAERVVFLAERDRLVEQLGVADAALRDVLADRDKLLVRHSAEHIEQTVARATQEATRALRAELVAARAERDALRAELAETRSRRDDLRLRLLDAELLLAGTVTGPAPRQPQFREIDAARRRIDELATELAATRATVSWRVTAPLRAIRKKTRHR